MKFLLIRPGDPSRYSRHFTTTPSTMPPLGLLYISAALEKEGHSIEVLDSYMENITQDKLKNEIVKSDAVGVTVFTSDLKAAKEISKTIRDIDSDIPFILGGPHCTFVRERALKDIPCADDSIVGEGERVVVELSKPEPKSPKRASANRDKKYRSRAEGNSKNRSNKGKGSKKRRNN